MLKPPAIAISPNAFPAEDRALYPNKALEYSEVSMGNAVLRAGGLPLIACRAALDSPRELAAHAASLMERCDGLLLSGGADVAPASYGEGPADPAWAGEPERDAFELALYRAAITLGRPVLGVCRGAQLINVAEGGSLWQDLGSLRRDTLCHKDGDRYDAHGHAIALRPGSEIAAIFGADERWVNSVHHQAVRGLAPTAEAAAHAPDGVVEAFTVAHQSWVLGIQWHPEWMQDRPGQRRIFEVFVTRCAR